MRGEIKIENSSLLNFMNMTFENIGRGEINTFGYFIKKVLHGWRYISNYNLPGRSKKNVEHHYDIGGEKGEKLFDEIFLEQKKRINNAFKNSDSDSVIKFKSVLHKIINE